MKEFRKHNDSSERVGARFGIGVAAPGSFATLAAISKWVYHTGGVLRLIYVKRRLLQSA